MANAFRRQARNVEYPDYKPKEDFSLWLAGYQAKVRNAFGYSAAEIADLKAEIVRSLPGKLQAGTALDTYERLSDATKVSYELLTEALSREFVDPQEKARFLEDFAYNKRKKGQSLKEFMQEIVKDQNRYSGMRDTIGTGPAAVPNTEKIKDGIRRFKKGIRNKKGKVDKDQSRHLRYNLLGDDDLNWKNALEVASRWEAANDFDGDSSDSSSSSDSEDSVDAVECDKKKKKSSKSTKKDKKSAVVINSVEESGYVATLADKVETNARDIKGVKSEQERLTANVTSWKNENSETLNQILSTVQTIQTNQGQPQRQFGNGYGNRNFQYRNSQRPNTYTWKGRYGQNQQTNFRYNRSSPQNFRGGKTSATATTPAAASSTALAPAQTVAAAIEEMDPAAQLLGAEGGETVTVDGRLSRTIGKGR